MDLLDEDSAVLKMMAEKKKTKKGTGRKAKDAGVSRFASLNKFKASIDDYKKKNNDKLSLEKKVINKKNQAAIEKKFQRTQKTIKPIERLVTKKETISKQIENKVETISEQKENKVETISEQIGNEKGIVKGNNFVENIIPDLTYNTLIGHQKNIINFIFFECSKNGSLTTSKLSISIIAKNCNIKPSVVKTSIVRLKKKGFLKSIQGKNGRGGWSIFELPKHIYIEIKNADEYEAFQESVSIKRVTKKETEQGTITSSSSSVNLNKKNTTTTKVRTKYELPQEWQALNLTNLDEIGFRNGQLLQIYNAGTSFDIVSESLEALRHDVLRKKIPLSIRNPLGMVMKLLRVQKEPYHSFDKDYVNEADKAILEMMKIKKEKALKIQIEREELQKIEFENWKMTLNREAKKKIVGGIVQEGGVAEETFLKNYYLNNIMKVL